MQIFKVDDLLVSHQPVYVSFLDDLPVNHPPSKVLMTTSDMASLEVYTTNSFPHR